MKAKLPILAMMAVVTVLFVSGCTLLEPPESPPDVLLNASQFCGMENVDAAYECPGYVKVVSSLLGGGATYYSHGQPISCPVVGPDSQTAQCKSLSELECTDACSSEPGPIGGQRDEHGCLGPAGYSWDESVGACIRPWELNESQKEAAGIAVDFLGWEYATTITDVETFYIVTTVGTIPCPGCFSVTVEKGEARDRYIIWLSNWTVSLSGLTYHQCTDAEKAQVACTMEYLPVCGYTSDGSSQTYGNKCGACAAGVDYWESGEC
ncbi:MAG: hypothetical protein V1813_01875 [Candidatus Aenigmatarchaeota archaeon]